MIRNTGLGLLALLVMVGCSGSDGADGANGADGMNGTDGTGFETSASVSGVFPGTAFLGQVVEVTMSGFATNWDETTTVSFGDGVSVTDVRVASPTALIATVEITNAAAMGLRDVQVTTGTAGALTYASGFKVLSPIALEIQGTAAQGSVLIADIKNLDPSRPFDTTATGDGLFEPFEFTNVAFDAPEGVEVVLNDVTATNVNVLMLIDASAAAGPMTLDVLSGPAGSETVFPNPAALEIAARTPTALTADLDVTLAEPYDTQYVSVLAEGGLNIVELTATAPGAAQLISLGGTGNWAQSGPLSTSVGMATDGTLHALLWDNTGDSGYSATIGVTRIPATATVEGASNDIIDDATMLTLPTVVQNASLSSETDEDWFVFVATAADVGKQIVVRTFGEQTLTDTYVDVLDTAGVSLGAGEDNGYHEHVVSAPIEAAGEHYIQIYGSPGFFNPTYKAYDTYVYLAD